MCPLFHGVTGRNVEQSDPVAPEPLQRLGNQLRAIIHPQHLRWATSRGEHRFDLGDEH